MDIENCALAYGAGVFYIKTLICHLKKNNEMIIDYSKNRLFQALFFVVVAAFSLFILIKLEKKEKKKNEEYFFRLRKI